MDIMIDSFEHNQSQSRDCEPSPPIPRHGSKTNFFSPSEQATRAAYIVPKTPWSPYGTTGGPPTPRAPRASIPMDERSMRSSIGEHNMRSPAEGWSNSQSGFNAVNSQGFNSVNSQSGWSTVNSPRSQSRTPPRSLTSPVVSGQQSPSRLRDSPGERTTPGHSPATGRRSSRRGGPPTPHYRHHASGSPNRRFVSESELARAAADRANGNYEARANQTADNIQELVADGSGRFRMQRGMDIAGLRASGGVGPRRVSAGGSSSPQQGRHKTPAVEVSPVKPTYPKRPVSIKTALELTENFDRKAAEPQIRLQPSKPLPVEQQDDRKSLYEMNYEISV